MDTAEEREAFYDAEVAPVLLELAKKCQDNGLPFVAAVEWSPEDRGITATVPDGSSITMVMTGMAARCKDNFDALVMGVLRHCDKNGIDTRPSIVATLVKRA